MGIPAVPVLLFAFLIAEPTLSLKAEARPIPGAVAKALHPFLSVDSYRVSDGDQPVLTIWLRKELPLEATADQIANGVTYRELPRGSLVGCIELHRTWTDFRKQEIKAGIYTLRLAVQPATGDHEGTAPYQDFCLLCPAELDTDAEPKAGAKLVEMSSKATGSAHPSPMLLFPGAKPGDLKEAKLAGPAAGIRTLNVALDAKGEGGAAKIGFAFVVEGVRKE